jgi:NAD-dependent dihydropyrimidine dehydrogenase PreA subunit
MKRTMIHIDEDKCNGCGACVPNCHEGALQIIDGKARLVSDLMCDGLGACIGHCPLDAITLEEREAEPYNEILVIEEMAPKGRNTIKAHLIHMKEHKEFGFMKEGIKWLRENLDKVKFDVEDLVKEIHEHGNETKKINTPQMKVAHQGGCPSSQAMSFKSGMQMAANENNQTINPKLQIPNAGGQSALQQWPVQLHLLNPNAEYLQNSDLLIAADCTAFSMGNFHSYLQGKSLAIACPKLDSGKEIYIEKLQAMIDNANVNTITVMMMEVPCCGGLLQLVQTALKMAKRYVPVKVMIVGIKGDVLSEDWAPPVK